MTIHGERRAIEMRLSRARAWRWQFDLADRLAADPAVDLTIRFTDGPPLPAAFDMLRMLENCVFRLHGEHVCDRLDEAAFSRWTRTDPAQADLVRADLVLDFAPRASAGPGASRHIRVLYDNAPDEDALLTSVLAHHAPALSVVDQAGHVLASARPAIENPLAMTSALDAVWSALLRLVLKVVRRTDPRGEPIAPRQAATRPLTSPALASFGARTLARKLGNRLTRLSRTAQDWFVAWRRIDDTVRLARPAPGTRPEDYIRMACDAHRYYADPFLFEAGGAMHLFVEEFPFATGKGLISVATFTEGGLSPARPVLETDTHLSYPHVFAGDGEIWMIPETLQARTVELYRAERFPDRWTHETTLLADIEASDATVCRHGGLWWMFAATREWQGSNWDSLGVFFAERLKGPWHPHPDNPVLIDSHGARPAGQFFHHGGALWRPAQDCSENYGTGLSLCRIDRLDTGAVTQTVEAGVRLRGAGVTRGPHTFNRAGDIEVIDLLGSPDALRAGEPAR